MNGWLIKHPLYFNLTTSWECTRHVGFILHFLSSNGLYLPLRKCFSPNPALLLVGATSQNILLLQPYFPLHPHDWTLSNRSALPLATRIGSCRLSQPGQASFMYFFLTGAGGKMLPFFSGGQIRRAAHSCFWPCFQSLLTSCLKEWSLNADRSRDERHGVICDTLIPPDSKTNGMPFLSLFILVPINHPFSLSYYDWGICHL